MLGLWRKEFRSMLPLLSLAVAIAAFNVLYETSTGLPNEKPWEATYRTYVVCDRGTAVMIFLFILALASGLLVREYDDDTMEFLDSLPVTRSRIFAVKIAMAMLVLLVLTVLTAACTPLLHAFSRTSLDRSFHWRFWCTAVGMRMCQALVLVSLGVACSFFRRFGWLLIGLLFWAYILLHERVPAVAVLDVLALASPELDGHEWVIPLRPLLVQLALGAALMLAAYAMFLGAGDAVMRGLRRLSNTRVGGVVLLSASLLIGLVGLSLAYYAANAEQDGREEGGPRAVTVTYPGWSISRAGSRRYEFIYPTNFSSLALSLVAAADAVHEEVRRFFDAEPGEPIVVDASTTVPRHAGVAHWEKIRLDLAAAEDPAALESTLGHETAHVFLDRLSDSRLGQHADSTRFFHEGVATYVQCRLFDRSGRLARLRRVAAVMRARGEVHCEELVDHALLAAKRDRDLVYPLGEIFVAEMVARHGDAAIGRIARAMVRKGAPRGLSGLEFWRDAFQSCGYDFDGLLEAFYARLDDEVKRHRAFIDALPRVRGSVTCDAGWIEVRGLWHPVEPWHLVCRFRQEQDSPDRSYIDGIRMDSETFGVLRGSFPSATVWYQLGLCHPDGTTIFEPWTRIQLTD